MKRWWSLVALTLIPILAYALDLVRIRGESMSPGLCDADIVVARRIWPNEDLEGKIVVAKDQDGAFMVRRVLATGGDRFRIYQGSSIRNEVPVAEPYLCKTETNTLIKFPEQSSLGQFQVALIPKESVFLLGDNRAGSGDSRLKGPVPVTNLRDVVLARLPAMFQRHSCRCVTVKDQHFIMNR